MSSIPNSAMPHAKVHHDDDHKPKADAKKTATGLAYRTKLMPVKNCDLT